MWVPVLASGRWVINVPAVRASCQSAKIFVIAPGMAWLVGPSGKPAPVAVHLQSAAFVKI